MRAIDSLPADWWDLYLGHVPIQAYFVRGGLLRTRSGCTPAYLANRPLLNWLATTRPMGPDVPTWPLIGRSIDSAMSSLPELYALFLMIARQRFLGDYRVDSRVDDRGRRRAFTDVDRWRYLFIFRGARFAEAAAVVLRRFIRGRSNGRAGKTIAPRYRSRKRKPTDGGRESGALRGITRGIPDSCRP